MDEKLTLGHHHLITYISAGDIENVKHILSQCLDIPCVIFWDDHSLIRKAVEIHELEIVRLLILKYIEFERLSGSEFASRPVIDTINRDLILHLMDMARDTNSEIFGILCDWDGLQGDTFGDLKHKKELLERIQGKQDDVKSPSHYTDGGIETIEYLKAKLSPSEFLGFLKGNILKYSSRAGKKDDELKDFKKTQWYVDRLLKELTLD